jgi:transposase
MQELLPLIPHGANRISENLSVIHENGEWVYFHGCLPIFNHSENDMKSFRMISSSFINNGICKNIDIIKVFNVSKSSVIRSSQKFKDNGSCAFFSNKKTRGSATILTPAIIEKAEDFLYYGFSCSEIAKKLKIKVGTLRKGISDGRVKRTVRLLSGTNKSERSLIDSKKVEEMGVACTRPGERLLAALGLFSLAESKFTACYDVSNAGVLAALPALALNGLYHDVENVFDEFTGYYSITQVLTLLGFMALCRIKTVEKLGQEPPGEWGKLLGLDRMPGVKCLRDKLTELSKENRGSEWGEVLSQKWMNDYPELAGVLYIDGHVRLYGGKENIPKQYVSRERLCLRGMMDFWVNDMLGQPFFVVRKDINPGMISVLRDDIVPQLLKDIPNQPSEEELKANKLLHRFVLVFDREGYSPVFFKEMWTKHRIACMTYHKYPKEDWKEEEFKETAVTLVSGETVEMKLAERGSFIGNKKDGVWVKEVRKLTNSGHQTSIVSTGYMINLITIAVLMFARWCQENFFNYMMQHFAIDSLIDYNKKEVSDTDKVISREWRQLEKNKNSLNGKLTRQRSRFYDFTLNPMIETDTKKYKEWEKTKIDLAEEINILTEKLKYIKEKQEKIKKHVIISELPEKEQFKALDSSKKNLVDVIKMVSYRAETAMGNLIANDCGGLSGARALLQTLFVSEADILPDNDKKILNIRFHNLSTRALDLQLDKLIIHLNDSEMKYPGTHMLLRYTRIGEN